MLATYSLRLNTSSISQSLFSYWKFAIDAWNVHVTCLSLTCKIASACNLQVLPIARILYPIVTALEKHLDQYGVARLDVEYCNGVKS